ncbi:GOLPH3/VPS74 family protein [Streptomonospora wellingtoniae]|uniref:GPP34 family phosphoprotein n=1 Tax=Streptomonospora wellingtoniae TaxID=3075544 RepID=A0ABU2KZC8_9ACTN|nr:GPP34 family phosphoprotein [Streptomonospora sp. DSM 45055]MDT0304373.1 GPP34 family phosphoprotein [Streptomonospora sp. DSM 45055]
MNPPAHPRILTDDLLLLAYRPDTGRPMVDANRLQCGLAGALIAETVLAGTASLDDGGHLRASGRHRTGDPDVDGAVEQIASQPKARKAKWWVQRMNKGALRKRLLGRAVSVGALAHEQGRALGIFPTDDYRPARPGSREEAVERLRSVLTGRSRPDPRSAALVALVGAVRLDAKLFPDIPGGDRRRRIKAAMAGDDIGRAVRDVIQSIEGAVVAAVAAGGAAAGGGS